jgi:glycosyltransferase involved in cell wall biosynthesis
MNVSVVIGTYNRAHLLEGTLHALALQEAPDSLKWEIVVVDNNSRDTTALAVDAFSKTTAIPVRYVLETRQGLSHARNRGIREARGSVIAFTDDDVLPAADWVAQVHAAIDRWNASGVGGRILPRWEASPPDWLIGNPRLLDRLSIMDFGEGRLLALWPRGSPCIADSSRPRKKGGSLAAEDGENGENRGTPGKVWPF